MKKILSVLFCFFLMQGVVKADKDRPIPVEELPAKAREFINTHFPGVNISYAKIEDEIFDISYEVVLVNSCKIEFDKQGEWTDIDCKYTQVPDGAVPEKMLQYVRTQHKDQKIIDIEKKKRVYEVKLNNKLELIFDLSFNFLTYD